MSRLRAFWQDRLRGRIAAQSVVELAITLPILLLLIVGLINLGVLINAQIILTQAAWEGARAGATLDRALGEGDAQIQGAALAALGPLDGTALGIDIDPAENEAPRNLPGPEPRGTPLTVILTYPMELSLPLRITVNLSAQATSRLEYSNPEP